MIAVPATFCRLFCILCTDGRGRLGRSRNFVKGASAASILASKPGLLLLKLTLPIAQVVQ